ncbi:MAG: ChbG/HpnK family deacetylase [Phycisphaerales bacterium]|jgi:hypothetical protein
MKNRVIKLLKLLPVISIYTITCIAIEVTNGQYSGQQATGIKQAVSVNNPLQNDRPSPDTSIRIIIRGDDIGFSNAANLACIKAYNEGILTTTEVMATCPWFLDAANLLQETPGLDVGVHLTLTSEWDNYKWGPITNAPSLVTEDGYFPASNNGFLQLDYSLEEVELELRAQIELALKYIPHISHLSIHMGAPTATPELNQIVQYLSEEYNLPVSPVGVRQWYGMWAVGADQKEDYLANLLSNLQSGLYVLVCHPALNNEES